MNKKNKNNSLFPQSVLYGLIIGFIIGAGFLYFAAQEEAKTVPANYAAGLMDS